MIQCWFFHRDNGTWSTIIFDLTITEGQGNPHAINGSKDHETFHSALYWQHAHYPDAKLVGGDFKAGKELDALKEKL